METCICHLQNKKCQQYCNMETFICTARKWSERDKMENNLKSYFYEVLEIMKTEMLCSAYSRLILLLVTGVSFFPHNNISYNGTIISNNIYDICMTWIVFFFVLFLFFFFLFFVWINHIWCSANYFDGIFSIVVHFKHMVRHSCPGKDQ